jgi:hypothetical protein
MERLKGRARELGEFGRGRMEAIEAGIRNARAAKPPRY